MEIAWQLAQLSTCARRSVGCVLTDSRDRIIAVGYNGVPSGIVHCTVEPCPGVLEKPGEGLDVCRAVHAEQNAITVCEKPFEIAAAYVTSSPCVHCIKILMNTSCGQIFYKEDYPHPRAKDLWLHAGREWIRLE